MINEFVWFHSSGFYFDWNENALVFPKSVAAIAQ
jgi:hypothetical protein